MSEQKKNPQTVNIAQALAAVAGAQKATKPGGSPTNPQAPNAKAAPQSPAAAPAVDGDRLAQAAAQALNEHYKDQAEPTNPNIQFKSGAYYEDEKPFPTNMVILLLFTLGLGYYIAGKNHEKILTFLPEPLKLKFSKLMSPFSKKQDANSSPTVSDYQNRAAQAADAIDRDPTQDTPTALGDKEYQLNDSRQYVQIKGKYYLYNPDNIYVIDGQSVYYRDPRYEKPAEVK